MPRAARLIVVSADIVSSAEFSGYVDGLSCTGLLRRIFVDECHTVIMDIGYRAKLGELVGLRRFGRPLVLLTATLPVVLEDWFRGEMLAKSAIIVRDRTVKLNCRYEVQQVKPGRDAIEDRTVEVIKQLDQDMTGCQKGVIYCLTDRPLVVWAKLPTSKNGTGQWRCGETLSGGDGSDNKGAKLPTPNYQPHK